MIIFIPAFGHLLTATVLVEARFTPLIDGAAGLARLLVFGIIAAIIYSRLATPASARHTPVLDRAPAGA